MTRGRRGADGAENPLTKRDLASTSEELGQSVSTATAHRYAISARNDRGQTGVDKRVPWWTDVPPEWAAWWRDWAGRR